MDSIDYTWSDRNQIERLEKLLSHLLIGRKIRIYHSSYDWLVEAVSNRGVFDIKALDEYGQVLRESIIIGDIDRIL